MWRFCEAPRLRRGFALVRRQLCPAKCLRLLPEAIGQAHRARRPRTDLLPAILRKSRPDDYPSIGADRVFLRWYRYLGRLQREIEASATVKFPVAGSSFRSSNQTGSRHPCTLPAHARHALKYPCKLRPHPQLHGLQVPRAEVGEGHYLTGGHTSFAAALQPYAFARVFHIS